MFLYYLGSMCVRMVRVRDGRWITRIRTRMHTLSLSLTHIHAHPHTPLCVC
jgi:hypothetical protein